MQHDPAILTNALLLGLRHGLDWDHLAAISDIVGTDTFTTHDKNHAMKLSTCYALGHAAVVTILGSFVIFAGNFVPGWWGPIAEKLVGITLIVLGLWLAFSSSQSTQHSHTRRYTTPASILIGMIHGVGAETGSQIVLLATVAGATNIPFAFFLLSAFILGLLTSNATIAAASIAGFTSTARFRKLSTLLGAGTAFASIALGISLLR